LVETGAVTWHVEHREGSAQALHDAWFDAPELDRDVLRRTVRVHHVTGPALVLGSTQPIGTVDVAEAGRRGIEVARRRSGGGAVLMEPGDHVWVDVFVPAGDPLWDDDVGRSSWWLGEAWAAAVGGGLVHRGAVTDRDAARVVCFAALGPGEVERDGRKVVGISQRRTRAGARFQCVAYREWRPDRLLALLDRDGVGEPVWSSVVTAVEERARAGVGPAWSVVEDLVPTLP
jgi:lipoate---protein ligase